MQSASTLPVSGERIAVVDVLRAYALFGIIVTHSVTGFLAGQPPSPDFMTFSSFDRVVSQLEHLLTFGKFFTIFSFLFGLSFAIQLRNATQKGVGFSGRFTWRLLVLALIALVHGAFFTGDILIIYALLGLLLIPFRKLKTRTLRHHRAGAGLQYPGPVAGHRADQRATPDAGAACSQRRVCGAVHASHAAGIRAQAIGLPGGDGTHSISPSA